jgi:RNA polymerase sigma factor (sigma-70 family)
MADTTGSKAKPAGSVTSLLDQVRSGSKAASDAATAAIVRRYLVQFSRLVKRQVAPRLKARVDAEDVALCTFHSFCVRLAGGQFELEGRDDFWHLLVQIATNKLRKQVAAHSTQKRDAIRDRGLTGADGFLIDVLDRRTPTPEDAAIVAEEMACLLARLPADIRRIAVWKFEGFTNEEIAGKLDCTLRTVERKLSLIRAAWAHANPAPAS